MITIYLLAAVGLTFIVTDSKICKPLREYVSNHASDKKWLRSVDSIINCPQCMGLYAGLLISLVGGGGYLLLPFASSFLCYFFGKIIQYINRH